MVSALFDACVKGDLQSVMACLESATPADLEVKDHTGCTPLIEAIKNGHVEIVDALLKKGADPHNRSDHAQPEQYTSDVAIHDLLAAARDRRPLMDTNPTQNTETAHGEDGKDAAEYAHQQQPSYYPTLNGPPPLQPDGTAYYGPQPSQNGENGVLHLPPPDVARMIPCRYFPACRYGASCMFLHPPGPYYQPPPPAQYGAPGYDPSLGPYPLYYPAPPPPHSYPHPPPPPNGVLMSPPIASAHSLPPPPPPHPMVHSRSASELPSPASAHPHSHPYSPPPPPMPYGPMSSYPPPVHMMPPPPHPPPHMNQPTSPHGYPPAPYPIDPSAAAAATNGYQNGAQPPYTPSQPQQPQSAGPDGPAPHYRGESFARRGGGGFRRSSVGRKPPCFFYPVGKCKNGDECRFPHVLPTEGANGQNGYPNKNGNGGMNGRRSYQNGGTTGLEDKMKNMSVRENGYDNRSRFPMRNGNGTKPLDKKSPTKVQRVPNPDEFPVLAGSVPSRSHSPGSTSSIGGSGGPTAAQVLQRPAPQYREKVTNGVNGKENGKEANTRVPSPDTTWTPSAIEQVRSEPINGQLVDLPRPVAPVAIKQMTFAAVATAA